MKVKRFLAKDMRHALAQVREEFGADAVMLSNRTLPDGKVEVVAACKPEQHDESSAAESQPAETGRDVATYAGSQSEFARLQREAIHNASTPYLDVVKDRQLNGQSSALRKTLENIRREREKGALTPPADTLRKNDVAGDQGQDSVAADPAGQGSAPAAAPAVTASEVFEMRSELSGIRNLLQQRLHGLAWEQFASRTPVQATVWERLNAMGLPGYLKKNLLQRLKPEYTLEQAWRFSLAYLSRAIPVCKEDLVAQGGVFAFLGSTGAGKTTTVGKLATRYVMEHGADSVALVTTDSYRIAAHEQLRTLGRILGVTVRVVDHKHPLDETLKSLSHKALVLIDTAGLNPRDPDLQEQLQVLRGQQQVKKMLVLACTSQGQVLKNALKTYSSTELSACILTRLDEAGALGEALALLIENKLPVAYETFGQAIPEDIRVAQAHKLVSRGVMLSRQNHEQSGDREELMSEFGGVWSGAASQAPAFN